MSFLVAAAESTGGSTPSQMQSVLASNPRLCHNPPSMRATTKPRGDADKQTLMAAAQSQAHTAHRSLRSYRLIEVCAKCPSIDQRAHSVFTKLLCAATWRLRSPSVVASSPDLQRWKMHDWFQIGTSNFKLIGPSRLIAEHEQFDDPSVEIRGPPIGKNGIAPSFPWRIAVRQTNVMPIFVFWGNIICKRPMKNRGIALRFCAYHRPL